MNKDDIAYAAGLFDAEGHISIDKQKRKSKIFPNYSLSIGLSSMNQPELNWFKASFSGFIRITNIRITNRKILYFQWVAKTNTATNFLRQITPYLQIKKLQAKLALQFQNELQNTFRQISPRTLWHRDQFRNQMLVLNRKHSSIEFSIELMNGYKIPYVAGLLDGDGSIFISIRKFYINPHHYVRIDIGSANRPIIYWLRNNFDGSILVRKPYFSWSVERNLAENILQQTLPYLRIKKPQAKLALQFRKEKKQNRGRRLTPEILQRREQFRQQMHALNQGS